MGVGFCMYTITRDDTANLNGWEEAWLWVWTVDIFCL